MYEDHETKQRVAALGALAARIRTRTTGAVAVSATLCSVFAGIADASAPGHKLHPGATALPKPTKRLQAMAICRKATSTGPPLHHWLSCA